MSKLVKTINWFMVLTGSITVAIFGLLFYLATTESGLQWTVKVVQPFVPGKLNLESVHGTLLAGPKIQSLRYQNAQFKLNIQDIDIDWELLDMLIGQLDVKRLLIKKVDLTLYTSQEKVADTTPFAIPVIERLPIRIFIRESEIQNIAVHKINQTLFSANKFVLSAQWVKDLIQIQQAALTTADYSVNINGDLSLGKEPHTQMNVQWQYNDPKLPPLAGTGSLIGSPQELILDHQLLQPSPAKIHAVAFNIIDKLKWKAHFEWDNVVLQTLEQSLPPNYLGGNLDLDGDLSSINVKGELRTDIVALPKGQIRIASSAVYTAKKIHVNALQVRLPGSETQIEGQGQYSIIDNNFRAVLAWQSLHWPLTDTWQYESISGKTEIEGELNNYKAQLAGQFQGENIPPGNWQLSGNGTLERFNIDSLNGEILDGQVQATGNIAWQPQIQWDASLDANDLNPGIFASQWPGKISMNVASQGKIIDNKAVLTAQLKDLAGQLRDYPLTGEASIKVDGNRVDIHQAVLATGKDQVTLSGFIADQLQLKWHINARDLSVLVPNLKGRVQGSGTLSGLTQAPVSTGQLNASELAYNNSKAGTTSVQWKATLNEQMPFNVSINTDNLALQQLQYERVKIAASGDLTKHQLALNGKGQETAIYIALSGGWQQNQWAGVLQRADWLLPLAGAWRLQKTVALKLSTTHIDVSESCWQKSKAHLCFSANGHPTQALTSQLSLKQVPLALLSLWLPPYIELQGDINGSLQTKVSDDGSISGKGHIEFPAGKYFLGESDNKKSFDYQGGTIESQINNSGFFGQGNFALDKNNKFDLKLNLDGYQIGKPLDNQAVDLQVNALFNKLNIINELVESVENISGIWRTQINVAGTLGNPEFIGHSDWTNGSMHLTQTGIVVDKINLSVDGKDKKQLAITGSARSDTGTLNLKGNLDLNHLENWLASLQIAGQNFKAVDLPEMRLFVSPEVNVVIAPNRIKLGGVITVPEATIKPPQQQGATVASSDAVIVHSNEATTAVEKWAVTSNLRLVLGEKVWFDGYGLKAWLKGDLALHDEPGKLTSGHGELGVREGTFRAFGRPLNIDRGRLVFRDSPITNPGLDVAASRSIEKEQINVGVKVTGTLLDPIFKMYSDPPMGQTDTLSYLMLGKPPSESTPATGDLVYQAASSMGLNMDEMTAMIENKLGLSELRVESGSKKEEASVTLGKYLSPRLFISYTFGLFDSGDQFNMRYNLTKKWRLEMETGIEGSGGDIFYSLEK